MIADATFAGRQLRGSRDSQEDYYAFCPMGDRPEDPLLLAVADGMGGHERGEIASETAVRTFISAFSPEASSIRAALLKALNLANTKLAEENKRFGGEPDSMGTTFVGLLIKDSRLHWVSVGDSLLYLYRKGRLIRLNEEHSAFEERTGPDGEIHLRTVLSSALTGGVLWEVDAPDEGITLEPGDVILCASDGIKTIPESRVATKIEVHESATAAALAASLVEAVENERRSRQDNVTIAVIKIPAA